jgi:hypothetical protein
LFAYSWLVLAVDLHAKVVKAGAGELLFGGADWVLVFVRRSVLHLLHLLRRCRRHLILLQLIMQLLMSMPTRLLLRWQISMSLQLREHGDD